MIASRNHPLPRLGGGEGFSAEVRYPANIRSACGLALLCLIRSTTAGFAAVSETPQELQAMGDFNGDNRPDIVIVDRATGAYRIGFAQSNGSHLWAPSRAGGIENVTGMSVGRLLDATRDALALTSPDANRVNVFDASSLNTPAQPTNVFLTSIGPNRVVAIDIGGAGNTAQDDLFTPSLLNNTNTPYRLTLTRSTGGSFSQIRDTNLLAEVIVADAVKLKTNSGALVGVLSRTAPNLTFAAQSLGSGAPVTLASAGGLPECDAVLFANFNNSSLNQFVFYKGGASNLVVRPALEPNPGQFQFGTGATFVFDQALRQIIAVPGPNDVRLLIIFTAGATAGVYSFDGANAPVLVESFAAEKGETFSGAAALGDGNFNMFSGTQGRSTRFQNWNRSGNGYAKGAGGDLPKLNPLTTSANVFLFAQPPFVHPAPRLLGTLNAVDWSSLPTVPAPPGQVTVRTEQFRSTALGLGNPITRSLGPAPTGAGFGLANQLADSFSLLSLSPAMGQEVIEVNISPKPGHYPSAVSVTFNTPAPAPVYYRLGNDENWQLYGSAPLPLFKTTTVSYYAMAGGRKSAIRRATYNFDSPPSTLDTDGDGVPDFVELGLGGGDAAIHSKDTDGDGYSDLAELLAGTNGAPYNVNIAPTNAPRADELAAFDWILSPRTFVDLVPAPAMVHCQTGTVISVFDLHGGLQRTVPAGSFFGSTIGYFPNLFADTSQRLYAAATEPHFDVRTNGVAGFTANADTRVGRELLAMTPIPKLSSPLQVNYTIGAGSPAQEASNWIAAAQAAQAAVAHPLFWNSMNFETTLAALLVERKASELLLARGLLNPTNRITLFPHRTQDAGRINPPHTNLLSLETNLTLTSGAPDPAKPGFKLTELHTAFSLAVTSPPSLPAQKLRELAFDIYRISGASNNVAPGQYPSPIDTLRGFLENGTLPSSYLAATTLSPADLSAAADGVATLLGGVSSRPTIHVRLRVTGDSFAANGCTVLETLGGSRRALILPDGTAYKFPEAFQLLPGSEVEVDAYTDTAPLCDASTLEVISLALTTIPAVSATDGDGDLLSDDWECLFLVFDPNADGDGDGASNLKEFLDGTDPLNALSHLAGENPAPPQIQLQATGAGMLSLTWFYPELYASRMKFELLATDSLGQAFAAVPGASEDLGGGQFRMTLGAGNNPTRFYQLRMSLK